MELFPYKDTAQRYKFDVEMEAQAVNSEAHGSLVHSSSQRINHPFFIDPLGDFFCIIGVRYFLKAIPLPDPAAPRADKIRNFSPRNSFYSPHFAVVGAER